MCVQGCMHERVCACVCVCVCVCTHTGGRPLVVSDPTCDTSRAFMELGACVVREVARQGGAPGQSKMARVAHDTAQNLIIIR